MNKITKLLKEQDENHVLLKEINKTGTGFDKIFSIKDIIEGINFNISQYKLFGIQSNDLVSVVGKNSLEYILTVISLIEYGAIPCLIDASLDIFTIEKSAVESGSKYLLIDKNISKLSDKNKIFNFMDVKLNQFDFFLIKNQANKSFFNSKTSLVIYSSGTTSEPKGVMLSWEGLMWAAEITKNRYSVTKKDSFLLILPISHIYGFVQVLTSVLSGYKLNILSGPDSENIKNSFKTCSPTHFCGVPSLFSLFHTKIEDKLNTLPKILKYAIQVLFKHKNKININLYQKICKIIFKKVYDEFGGSIKTFVSGGSACSRNVKDFFENIGIEYSNAYGMTEASLAISSSYRFKNFIGNVGKPVDDLLIKISEEGEILFKSPGVFLGYINDEVKSKEAFAKDGWLRTGDIGEVHEDGSISVNGRVKDVIMLPTGKKLSPDELEFLYKPIFSKLGQGIEFAVCGIESSLNKNFDEPCLFVKCKEDDKLSKIILEESFKIIEDHHKRIKNITFVEEIPRSSTKKVKRNVLRKLHLQKNNIKKQEVNETLRWQDKFFIDKVFAIKKIQCIKTSDRLFFDLGFDSIEATTLIAEVKVIDKIKNVDFSELLNEDAPISKYISIIEDLISEEDTSNNKANHDIIINSETDYEMSDFEYIGQFKKFSYFDSEYKKNMFLLCLPALIIVMIIRLMLFVFLAPLAFIFKKSNYINNIFNLLLFGVVVKNKVEKDNDIIISNHETIFDGYFLSNLFEGRLLFLSSVKSNRLFKFLSFLNIGKNALEKGIVLNGIFSNLSKDKLILFPEGRVVHHKKTIITFQTNLLFGMNRNIKAVEIIYKSFLFDNIQMQIPFNNLPYRLIKIKAIRTFLDQLSEFFPFIILPLTIVEVKELGDIDTSKAISPSDLKKSLENIYIKSGYKFIEVDHNKVKSIMNKII